jgi:WD40 repeat protein
MFEALASVYGSHLVKLILGFLAFSQKGVSHLELEDLLSLDAELMNCDENMSQDQLDKSVFQFHRDVKVKRVPSHVVVRVLNSLEDLVISGEQSCLQLYHRQLKEAAQDWLEESYKEIVCRHLAMYFGNLVTEQEVKQKRLSRQGWTKDGHSLSPFIEASTVNNRRCVEAVRAMLACGMLAEAEAELCNFESVCCRLRCGEAFAMVSDVIELDRKWSSSRTHHYLRWLRRDTHMMLCSPIKRLLTSASDQPKISLVFEDAAKFIAKMKDIYPELQYGRKFENNNDGFDASLYVVDVGFGNVRSVCYSPDGHQLASGSAYLACLWDAETGASLLELLKLRSMANSVCFAPDGSRVAVGSEDKAVRIVDAKSGTLLLELTELSGRVFSVCYSPNGQHLASALDHGTVCIWDIQTGVLKASCRHDGMVLSVCYSPNGSRLASGSSIGSVCVWNAETGDLMYQTEKHSGYASSVCYSPNGLFLASGSGKGAVRIWDAETGVLQHLLDKHTGRVASICYSPDGRRLASGSQDCTVRIWDPKTQACLKELRGHGGIVNSVCYSPDGRRLASASNDRTVRIWDANTDTPTPVIDGHSKGVLAVCFSPDGLRVASGSEDYTIRIWDAGRGALLLKLQEDFMCGYVTSVCYSRNGRRIASVSDRGVHIWDAETGKLLRAMTARTDEDMLSSVCFCADDNRVLAGFKSGSVSIGDTDSGNWGPMLSGHTNVVNAVCCAPNGRHWVSVSKEGAACIWGAEAGECFKTVTNEFLCFSTDGRRMISRSGKGMCILDLESCEELAEISGIHENRYVSSAAYNTENHIAAIAVKHEIYLWNMNTAELLNVLDGHSNRVESLCFSPDGRFLVSGSADSTIRIWEVV